MQRRTNSLGDRCLWWHEEEELAEYGLLFWKSIHQKPGDHPNFRKNSFGVKRSFSELSESSGVFSEQLSEFRNWFSECEIPFSEWHLTTWAIRKPQFSEQLPELAGTHMKDFHLPLHSRSLFSRMGWSPPFRFEEYSLPCEEYLGSGGRSPNLQRQKQKPPTWTAGSYNSLAVCIARQTLLAIWHRGHSHRRQSRRESPNRRYFASLDLKKHADFRIARQHRKIFAGAFVAFLGGGQTCNN